MKLLKIPSDTKGKNCNIKLSPEKYYTLNPEGIENDFTAAKGSRITIMKTTESRHHFETNIEYYSKGLTYSESLAWLAESMQLEPGFEIMEKILSCDRARFQSWTIFYMP